MVNKLRKMLRNEKGFTLVELLAVIVILGIIAAIAVPAVGSIIDNSKEDAHISNAKMIYEAARLYDVSEDVANTSDNNITLGMLITNGYIEGNIEVPSGKGYADSSFVNLENRDVVLFHIDGGAYINTVNNDGNNTITIEDLDRSRVTLDPS